MSDRQFAGQRSLTFRIRIRGGEMLKASRILVDSTRLIAALLIAGGPTLLIVSGWLFQINCETEQNKQEESWIGK